jgi:hypothetical protein
MSFVERVITNFKTLSDAYARGLPVQVRQGGGIARIVLMNENRMCKNIYLESNSLSVNKKH